MAAVVAAAAGVNVSPYLQSVDRKLTTEQVNQLMHGLSIAQVQAQQNEQRNVRESRGTVAGCGYEIRTAAAAQVVAKRQISGMAQSAPTPPAPSTSNCAFAYNRMKATSTENPAGAASKRSKFKFLLEMDQHQLASADFRETLMDILYFQLSCTLDVLLKKMSEDHMSDTNYQI